MLAMRDRLGVSAETAAQAAAHLFAVAAILSITACATPAPRIEAPQVSLESVRVTRIVDGTAELSVGLRLSNPNASALAIKAVDYEIMLDNRPAASGHTVRVDTLPAGGEAKVDLAGRVDVGAVAAAMMVLGSQLPVAYTLKGSVTVQGWASPISFSRSGKIEISKFDSAFGTPPR
jgi:LEA14-like dessication related protein